MTHEQIKNLILTGEGHNIEFKQIWTYPILAEQLLHDARCVINN